MIRDLRHAVRVHARRPWLTAACVLTLALGIGANTAIFNVTNGVLLRPLPYPQSGELLRVYQTYDALKTSPNPRLQAIWNRLPVSYLNVLDLRQSSRRLAGFGLYQDHASTFTGGGEPEELAGSRVDAELFEVLGVEPLLGRTFEREEVEAGARVAVLSHGFWQQWTGGDRGVLGRSLELDGEGFTVVGVMPPGFQIAGRPDDRLWTPIRFTDDDREVRDNRLYSAVARRLPGVSREAAEEEMTTISARLAATYPEANEGTGIRLVPLKSTVVDQSRPLLRLLMASVVVVLTVACVNVAHLLLAQAASRRRELAVRRALGAHRGRLARQLLAESLVLALAGGALGLLLAVVGQDVLLASIPADLPRTESIGVDVRVLAFTLGTSLAAALVCGLLPAWLASGASLAGDVRSGGRATGLGRRGGVFAHGGFVVAEIALTLMLTAGAGLLANSFLRLSAVDPGFATASRLTQEVRLPASRYGEAHPRADFADRLLAAASRLPGVEHAALTTKLPFAGLALVGGFQIPGLDATAPEDWTQGRVASIKWVTPGYFRALGIPLVSGRVFTGADRPESGRVVVVNETLVRRSWPPGTDPVGQTIVMGGAQTPFTVVGVVADIRHDGLEAEPGLLLYQPWSQGPSARLILVLETAGDPLALAPAVREAIRALDPALPLPAAVTLDELMARSLAIPRSRTALVVTLAVLALVLALVGIYAVMSFTVERRTREIGVRVALGASAPSVRALVLRRVLALTAWGVVLGTAGAIWGSSLLRGLLFGVEPTDPATLAVAVALIVATCLVAGYLPARRASRVDPVLALRVE